MKTDLSQRQIGKMGVAAIMLISSLTVMVGNAIAPALPVLGARICPALRLFSSIAFSWEWPRLPL